jgi:hypothetical protein
VAGFDPPDDTYYLTGSMASTGTTLNTPARTLARLRRGFVQLLTKILA